VRDGNVITGAVIGRVLVAGDLGRDCLWLKTYLTRFQTRSTRPPPADPAGLVYFNSALETVKTRFWVVPSHSRAPLSQFRPAAKKEIRTRSE
jgi:hypothetical protein